MHPDDVVADLTAKENRDHIQREEREDRERHRDWREARDREEDDYEGLDPLEIMSITRDPGGDY